MIVRVWSHQVFEYKVSQEYTLGYGSCVHSKMLWLHGNGCGSRFKSHIGTSGVTDFT